MEPKNDFDMDEFQRGMSAVGMQVIVIDENFKFPGQEEGEDHEDEQHRLQEMPAGQ